MNGKIQCIPGVSTALKRPHRSRMTCSFSRTVRIDLKNATIRKMRAPTPTIAPMTAPAVEDMAVNGGLWEFPAGLDQQRSS